MSRRKSRPIKHLQWRLECLVHSVLELIVGCLPGVWAFRLGELLGGLAWYLLPKRRNIVLRNLRVALAGEKSLPEIHQMAKATFRRSGANLISTAHTARLSPEQLKKVIKIENLELLEKSLADGRGVVLLLAHMGNWELLSRIVHQFPPGSKTGAFYRPLNNRLLDERVLARRQADGTRMFSKRDPFHQVTGFLREGGIVGILADQRVGMQGEVVPFFGRNTRTSPLPSLLARRAKSEVLALSLVTVAPGKWKAILMPVERPHTTRSCTAALEDAMRASPVDVFWLQERWRVFVKPWRTFQEWLPEGTPPANKPHRALLWLVDAPAEWVLPGAWQHPDLIYEVALAEGSAPPEWLPPSVRIHQPPAPRNRSGLRRAVVGMDASAGLPLDFIVAPGRIGPLLKAAVSDLVPVVSLP